MIILSLMGRKLTETVAALTASGMSAGYRARPVLHDMSLSFDPGLHLVLGPNGAGKTTLFRVLAGILRPAAGHVRILGPGPGHGRGRQVAGGDGRAPDRPRAAPQRRGQPALLGPGTRPDGGRTAGPRPGRPRPARPHRDRGPAGRQPEPGPGAAGEPGPRDAQRSPRSAARRALRRHRPARRGPDPRPPARPRPHGPDAAGLHPRARRGERDRRRRHRAPRRTDHRAGQRGGAPRLAGRHRLPAAGQGHRRPGRHAQPGRVPARAVRRRLHRAGRRRAGRAEAPRRADHGRGRDHRGIPRREPARGSLPASPGRLAMTGDRPLLLVRALAWRARAEGVRYLLIPVAVFAAVITLAILASLPGVGHVNGAKTLAAFAEAYGAHADAVTVGIGLLLGPGLVAVFSCIAVMQLVRTMIGTEASRGGSRRCWPPPTGPARSCGHCSATSAWWRSCTGHACPPSPPWPWPRSPGQAGRRYR